MPHVARAAPLEPGDAMPRMRAELLSGRKIARPDSVRGSDALLVMGFTYASRGRGPLSDTAYAALAMHLKQRRR